MRTWIGLFFTIYSITAFAITSSKNADLINVAKQIELLQQKISLDQQHQDNLEQELQTTEINIGQLSNQIDTLNQQVIREQQALNQLKNSQHVTTKKLSEQNNVLSEQIRAAFALGQINSTKIILNQNNPNTSHRYLRYFHYLTQARIQLIQKIGKTLSAQNINIRSIQQHQENLKKLLVEKKIQQKQHKQALQQRQNLLKKLHQNVQTRQQQLNTLLANQKALQDIITNLDIQTQTNLNPKHFSFGQNQKKLHWPTKGKIAANFGSLLDVGNQRLPGIVISAKQGTPVQAIFSGKVIFANWLRGFGLLIIIDHGNKYLSLYGRNHTLNVKVGDHVNTGDIIATIGNSGGFEKASLYFEIRQNGVPINPHIWCV